MSTKLCLTNYPEIDFSPFLSDSGQKSVAVSTAIKLNGTFFKKGYIVVLERNNAGMLLFGKIECIVCEDMCIFILIVNVYVSKYFDQHKFSHCIERTVPSETKLYPLPDLLDCAPLDSVRIKALS